MGPPTGQTAFVITLAVPDMPNYFEKRLNAKHGTFPPFKDKVKRKMG
jgi:hypothetical protein